MSIIRNTISIIFLLSTSTIINAQEPPKNAAEERSANLVGLSYIRVRNLQREDYWLTYGYDYPEKSYSAFAVTGVHVFHNPHHGITWQGKYETWNYTCVEQRDPRLPYTYIPHWERTSYNYTARVVTLSGYLTYKGNGYEGAWLFVEAGPELQLSLSANSAIKETNVDTTGHEVYSSGEVSYPFQVKALTAGLRVGFVKRIAEPIYVSVALGIGNLGIHWSRDFQGIGCSAHLGITIYYRLPRKISTPQR